MKNRYGVERTQSLGHQGNVVDLDNDRVVIARCPDFADALRIAETLNWAREVRAAVAARDAL